MPKPQPVPYAEFVEKIEKVKMEIKNHTGSVFEFRKILIWLEKLCEALDGRETVPYVLLLALEYIEQAALKNREARMMFLGKLDQEITALESYCKLYSEAYALLEKALSLIKTVKRTLFWKEP